MTMSTKKTSWARLRHRMSRWLRQEDTGPGVPHVDLPTADVPSADLNAGPGHAPGHKHTGPPPEVPMPRGHDLPQPHDQPWVPTGGLVDKQRRSERRS
jgi:hypothetical protein